MKGRVTEQVHHSLVMKIDAVLKIIHKEKKHNKKEKNTSLYFPTSVYPTLQLCLAKLTVTLSVWSVSSFSHPPPSFSRSLLSLSLSLSLSLFAGAMKKHPDPICVGHWCEMAVSWWRGVELSKDGPPSALLSTGSASLMPGQVPAQPSSPVRHRGTTTKTDAPLIHA